MNSKSMSPERNRPVISFEDLKTECEGDPKLEKLFSIVYNDCYRYTETVCEFHKILAGGLSDDEQQRRFDAMDARRTQIHNATMDSINALLRALGAAERDNTWAQSFLGNRAVYAKWILSAVFQELAAMPVAERE